MSISLKLLEPMASADRSWNRGERYETDAAEAEALIAAGRAVPWAEEKVERAVKPAARIEKRSGGGKA